MKAVAVFLSGLAVTLAGAFIRWCETGVSDVLSRSWCGASPPLGLISPMHEHCAGCVLIAVGLGLVAFSPMLLELAAPRPVRRASK